MLFFFRELLTFFKAVALALDVDDSGMMEDTVAKGSLHGCGAVATCSTIDLVSHIRANVVK